MDRLSVLSEGPVVPARGVAADPLWREFFLSLLTLGLGLAAAEGWLDADAPLADRRGEP
jgi:hypothetical protein